jgi:tetratricopeptide (TPR) repeat protein
MNTAANTLLTRLKSKLPLLRITYKELQYWFIGLTPEWYHWSQGSAWEEYGNYPRAIKHLKSYLGYKENAHARALLAYCYARLFAWEDALREYTAAIAGWPHPSFSLALAEAHMHLGNLSEAEAIVAATEAEFAASQSAALSGLEELKRQLREMSNNTMEPT